MWLVISVAANFNRVRVVDVGGASRIHNDQAPAAYRWTKAKGAVVMHAVGQCCLDGGRGKRGGVCVAYTTTVDDQTFQLAFCRLGQGALAYK